MYYKIGEIDRSYIHIICRQIKVPRRPLMQLPACPLGEALSGFGDTGQVQIGEHQGKAHGVGRIMGFMPRPPHA